MQKLNLVEAETLLYEPLEKPSFVVDGLIPMGLSLFSAHRKSARAGSCSSSAFACRRGFPFGICPQRRGMCFISVWRIPFSAYRTGCSV